MDMTYPKRITFTDASWERALAVLELFERSGGKRKVKEEAIAANLKCKALKRCVEYAYNPYKNYFVTPGRAKKSFIKKDAPPSAERLSNFLSVLDRLSAREVTGNAARDLLDDAIANGNEAERKWFRRIASRDFKSGIGVGTFNKFWPECVPSFEVALAEKYGDHEVEFPVWGEIKFDGHRMVVLYNAEDGTLVNLSRGGKEKSNVGHILDEVATLVQHMPEGFESFVLDGELFGEKFNDVGLATRKVTAETAEAAKALKFWVFDLVPLSAFREGEYAEPLKKRRKRLREVLGKVGSTNYIRLSRRVVLNNEEEVGAYYAKAVEDGHEGVMIKDPNSPYVCDRSPHWLKLKPSHDVSVTVVEVIRGKHKNADRMGAIRVRMPDSDVETNVGGGWRDDCRGHHRGPCLPEAWDCRVCLWKHRKKIRGWIFDAKAEKTTAIDTKKLRHARFAGRWRHDLM